MPHIYITAIITTIFALGIIGGIIAYKSDRKEWGFLLIILALVLPMQPLVYYLVRVPINKWLYGQLGLTSLYKIITTFYAPLTEEPAKLWVLLLPWIVSKIDKKNYIRVAMTIGLGFGIGEAWFIAYEITKVPELSGYVWYEYIGYLNERFMVCFAHGAFTVLALKFLRKRFLLGFIGAVALHYFGNLPIFIAKVDPLGWGVGTWQIILSLWIFLYLIAMALMVTYFAAGNFKLGKALYGTDTCPECSKEYDKPIFLALNLLNKRYERCPHCKNWHMMPGISRKKKKKKINYE